MSAAAAYDLRILAENGHRSGAERAIISTVVDKLIDTVGRAEAKRSPALVQLYKTVAALGAFLLLAGDAEMARRLRTELDRVPGGTREQILRELAAVEDPVFWELTDRVVNFDYVEPDVRAALPAFLGPVDTWPIGLPLTAEPLPTSPT
jgi:hypothetical protein